MRIVDYQYLEIDGTKIKLNERDFGRLIGLSINKDISSVTLSSGHNVFKEIIKQPNEQTVYGFKIKKRDNDTFSKSQCLSDQKVDEFVSELIENRKSLKGFDASLQFEVEKSFDGETYVPKVIFHFNYAGSAVYQFDFEKGKRFVEFLASTIGNCFWNYAESATFVVDSTTMFNLKCSTSYGESVELEYQSGTKKLVYYKWMKMTPDKAVIESERLRGLMKKELAKLQEEDSTNTTNTKTPIPETDIRITEHPSYFDIDFGIDGFSLEEISYGVIPPLVTFLSTEQTTEDVSITIDGKDANMTFRFSFVNVPDYQRCLYIERNSNNYNDYNDTAWKMITKESCHKKVKYLI